jgi:hypothetical protein
MKIKLFQLVIGFAFSLIVFAGPTLAAEVETSPRLLPDSPFYFMKSWAESLSLFFTFDEKAKAEKLLEFSNERLREAKFLGLEGKVEENKKALERYQRQLNESLEKVQTLKEKGKEVEDLAVKITEATAKHQVVLEGVYEKVPSQAREGILKAIEVSQKGGSQALESITTQKREEILNKINETIPGAKEKLEEIKNQADPEQIKSRLKEKFGF